MRDEVQEIAAKTFQYMLDCTELLQEIEEKETNIANLPPCPSYDDEGVFIPRDNREGLFFRAEQLKVLYDKVDELQHTLEANRRENLVATHKDLHPPNTEECPICLESIPIASNKCVQYFVCCGNICCFKCIQASVAGGKMEIPKCPSCRANLFIPSKESIRLTKQCADNGRSWAQTQIGIYYLEGSSCEHGNAVPYQVDKKEALRWFKLAAEQRDPDAIRIIAQLHAGVYGVVEEVEKCQMKARSFMKDAADLGNLRAQRNYAMMCRLGQGGPADKAEAAHYYSLAYSQKSNYIHTVCSDGQPIWEIDEAAYYLGMYYYYGYGEFSKNLSRAKFYLEEAARDGDRNQEQGYEPEMYMYIAACTMERYEHQYGNGDYNIPGYSPIPRALALYRKSAQYGKEHSKGVLSAIESHMKMMCANCGIAATNLPEDGSLKACIRCRSVWYCGKECQIDHWKDGHKADCIKFGTTGIPTKHR